MMKAVLPAALVAALSGAALLAASSGAGTPAIDPDTAAWWKTTAALSNDAMEGRDTGSPAYERAAKLVAARFAAAGLKPLGENKSWYQRVPMTELAVADAEIRAGDRRIGWLDEAYASPARLPETLDAPLAFRGYGAAASLGDVRGKMVIAYNSRRPDQPSQADRLAAVTKAGAAGLILIDDPSGSEPTRWPFAYSRSVDLVGPFKPYGLPGGLSSSTLPSILVAQGTLATLIAGSGQDAARLIAAAEKGEALPSFDLPDRLTIRSRFSRRTLSSPNVIGYLPGTDPKLAGEALVLSAHLDGYGFGKAVKVDSLYNGTLDDAAYVALLIRLAERRHGKGFRRPIVFLAAAGEEKGLNGSRWFVAHPTLPRDRIAGDINLDQLRPIFPLKLLTVHGLDDSTLGADARATAETLGIAVQTDPEPERNLIRRSDHWSFMQAGIPAVNFVFGFRPGSPEEKVYRGWYRTGYHKPQDDLNQPIDWTAARDFNRFFYALVERAADAPQAPAWSPGSKLRPGG